MHIAEYLSSYSSQNLLCEKEIKLDMFNTSVLHQSKNSDGKFTLQNLFQALYLTINLIGRTRKKNFKALHFNSSFGVALLKDQIILCLLKIFISEPIILQIHYGDLEEALLPNFFLRKLHLFLLKRMDHVILLSNNFRDQLISLGFSKSQLIVLYNFHVISPNQNIYDHKLDPLKLLFVGSICKRKGILDLLESLKTVDFQYELHILGEFSSSSLEIICREIQNSHNLNLIFHGYLESPEKEHYYINSDILVLPSYAEGFPMVIPEAMAYGCAIISTRISGIPEIVENGINGFLIDPGQVNLLRNKIIFLNNNRDVLINFRKMSLILSQKFDFVTYIDRIASIYNNFESEL
jgi:glycosyltransferase involved in cell wall biosynthesis